MMVIMPKIEKLLIMPPDEKAVISEHTADELQECQLAIRGTSTIIQYGFKTGEDDE